MKKWVLGIIVMYIALASISCIYAANVDNITVSDNSIVNQHVVEDYGVSADLQLNNTDNNYLDNDFVDDLKISQSNSAINQNHDNLLSVCNDDTKLSVLGSSSNSNLKDLQELIKQTPKGSTLDLHNDYNTLTDKLIIQIDKDIVIDGHGHTIDLAGSDHHDHYFKVTGGKVVFQNIRFINGYNNDDDNGGAILLKDSAIGEIYNCTFENCFAKKDGGAIAVKNNNMLIVKNSTFLNNHAEKYSGGAIWANDLIIIDNCTFKGNIAGDNGGALYAYRDANIQNSVFIDNKADSNGGAVCTNGGINMTFSNFTSNIAGGKGLSVYANKKITSVYCFYDDFYVCNGGGALYSKNNQYYIKNYNIDDLSDNKIIASGETLDSLALFIKYMQLSSAGDFVAENIRKTLNGTVPLIHTNILYLDGDFKTINNKLIIEISKNITIDGQGHTIDLAGGDHNDHYFRVTGGTVVFQNIHFINGYNNDDDNGGAILIKDSAKCEIYNCTFENCFAKKDGGAIAVKNNNMLIVNNSTFLNNRAEKYSGGAIWANDLIIIDNCTFKGNIAGDNGGALYAYRDANIQNSVFLNNKADSNGGAVCTNGGIDIKFSNFTSNTVAGKGLSLYANKKITSTYCICNGFYIYNGESEFYSKNNQYNINYTYNLSDNKVIAFGGTLDSLALFIKYMQLSSSGNLAALNIQETLNGIVPSFHSNVIYLDDDFETINDKLIIEISESITIDGQGHTIDLAGSDHHDHYFKVTGGTVVFQNIHFINGYNNDDDNGGAILIKDSAKCEIYNCTFENCFAKKEGGAIAVKNNNMLIVKNSSFYNNHAEKCSGGAIWANYLTIDNCTFESNTAGDHGGAVWACFIDFKPTYSYYRFNQCGKKGGAICVKNFEQAIYQIFDENHAKEGGAIFIDVESSIKYGISQPVITGCRFTSNVANKAGAIYYHGCDKYENSIIILNNVFLDNKADISTDIHMYNHDFNTSYFNYIIYQNWFGTCTPNLVNRFHCEATFWTYNALSYNSIGWQMQTKKVNGEVIVEIRVDDSVGAITSPILLLDSDFIFCSNKPSEFINLTIEKDVITVIMIPKEAGKYVISVIINRDILNEFHVVDKEDVK